MRSSGGLAEMRRVPVRTGPGTWIGEMQPIRVSVYSQKLKEKCKKTTFHVRIAIIHLHGLVVHKHLPKHEMVLEPEAAGRGFQHHRVLGRMFMHYKPCMIAILT